MTFDKAEARSSERGPPIAINRPTTSPSLMKCTPSERENLAPLIAKASASLLSTANVMEEVPCV
jgi:hypothetical protein